MTADLEGLGARMLHHQPLQVQLSENSMVFQHSNTKTTNPSTTPLLVDGATLTVPAFELAVMVDGAPLTVPAFELAVMIDGATPCRPSSWPPRNTSERLEETLSNARCFAQGCTISCCLIMEDLMDTGHGAEELGPCSHEHACEANARGPPP